MLKDEAENNPATKKEVEESVEKVVGKTVEKVFERDLGIWGGQLQQQISDVKDELLYEMDKKIDKAGDTFLKKIDDRIEQYVEIQADQHLGAKADEVDGIKTKVEGHDKRIEKLETRAGVR